MLIVTTHVLDGIKIREYKGPVFYQVVAGLDWTKSISAGWRNLVGGRSSTHEQLVDSAREEALNGIADRARRMGAGAIVGLTVDYEMISGTQNSNGLLLVKLSGTAVVV